MACENSPVAPSAPATFGNPSLPQYIEKALATPDAEQITEEITRFQKATFWGYKSFTDDVPNLNESHIMIGFSETHFTRMLLPGRSLEIVAPTGQKFDLSTMWILGTVGDGVVVEYS